MNGLSRNFDSLLATTTTTGTGAIDVANHGNESTSSSHGVNRTSINPTTSQIRTLFAIIDEVFPNSPASIAGIQLND